MEKTAGSRHSRGQSLIIVAFAMITLVAFVGLAVDLGLVYVERIRIRRAADAAALAAAAELPLEPAAHVRALEYLQENNYPCGLQNVDYVGGNFTYQCNDPTTRVEINAGYPGANLSGPDADSAQRVISINTIPYRDNISLVNSAGQIEVQVSSQVQLYFMRVLGFNAVPVSARAVGENINDLDIVLAFDESTSMEFDTICYGCWSPTGAAYPIGQTHPLPWNNGEACNGDGPLGWKPGSHNYVIIEAEDYSYTNVPYDRDIYVTGMTYWALQRNGGANVSSHVPSYMRRDNGAGALGRDEIGAYMSHRPGRTHINADGQGATCTWDDLNNGRMCLRDAWSLELGGPFPAPRLDYDFTVPTDTVTNPWHFWVRGTGGDGSGKLFWGLNGNPESTIEFDATNRYDNGPLQSDWQWLRMGSKNLNPGESVTLNIWAGAAAGNVDRIVITDEQTKPGTTSILNNVDNIDNRRTDQACDPCDARYGGHPDAEGSPHPTADPSAPPRCVIPGFAEDHPKNQRYNDWLYDDEQPIRAAIESSKRFVARLDPRYDQIGLVTYDNDARIRNELQCVKADPEASTKQVITDTVISDLDALRAGGGTNIPNAINLGIDVLSNKSGHNGRPSAAHIMILMTDGETHNMSGTDGVCDDQDYWPHPSAGGSSYDRAKDCAVYYAMLARNNGIVIYTITLGGTADIELLAYIAEITGGVHRHAPRAEQLDPIFDELYERIFLRLVE